MMPCFVLGVAHAPSVVQTGSRDSSSCRRSNRLGLWLAATSQNYLSLLQNPELGTIDVGTKARQGEPIKMSVLHVALRFEEALFKKLISLKNETGLKGMAIVLWRHTGILVRC